MCEETRVGHSKLPFIAFINLLLFLPGFHINLFSPARLEIFVPNHRPILVVVPVSFTEVKSFLSKDYNVFVAFMGLA